MTGEVISEMNRQFRSNFWKAYFLMLIRKYFPIKRIELTLQVRIVLLACLLLSILTFLISFFSGWYSSQGTLDGLWVEFHGVLIEVFIFAFLFDWIIRKREEIRYNTPKLFVYSKIYNITNDSLNILNSQFREKGEKQYVYFTRVFEISRNLDTPASYEPSIDIADKYKFDKEGGEFLIDRYSTLVEETISKFNAIQVSLRSRDAKQDIPVNSFALDHRQPVCAPDVPVTSPAPGPR